jgi:acyl carrier protein
MSTEDLKALVRRELSAIAPEADLASLDERADVRVELDLDSMDVLRFASALHDRLGIDIPETDYPRITSVLGCVEYLQQHIQ